MRKYREDNLKEEIAQAILDLFVLSEIFEIDLPKPTTKPTPLKTPFTQHTKNKKHPQQNIFGSKYRGLAPLHAYKQKTRRVGSVLAGFCPKNDGE